MSESKYEQFEQRFGAYGQDLASPPDAPQRANRLAIGKNVRQVLRGTLQCRNGTSVHLTSATNETPWHSLRRLNDPAASDFTYIAGIGDSLQFGKTGTLAIPSGEGSGWSGNPLSLVPFVPEQAVEPWMAVADSLKLRKIKRDGTVRTLGIEQPKIAPLAELDYSNGPLRINVDTGGNFAGWSGGATNSNRINVAFTRQVWAGEDPTLGLIGGWFAIQLASIANIGPGTILTDSLGAIVHVEEVHPASPTGVTCTIKQIIFDGGTGNGWCTIVPTVNFKEFTQHALVQVNTGTPQYVALTHTIAGPDNTVALRCYMPFSSAVEGVGLAVMPSVYGYSTAAALTGPLTTDATRWNALAASTKHTFTRTIALNLSNYASGGRSVDRVNDEMHISLFTDEPDRITEIRVEADVDDATFTKNYFTRTIRSNDLVLFRRGDQPSTDARPAAERLGRYDRGRVRDRMAFDRDPNEVVGPIFDRSDLPDEPGSTPTADAPGGASSQTSAAASQWSEIRFKLSDWTRFGEDKSKDLHAVNTLRVTITTNDRGVVDVRFNSWWIGGGFEPDVALGAPYDYEYRYRDSSTGARSNWSPPSRTPVWPHRHQVFVSVVGTTNAGCDKIDIRRRGGTINTWVTIATIQNPGAASVVTFTDIYSDAYAFNVSASDAAVEGNVNAQPFSTIAAPFVATVAEIAGSMIRHGTSGFNVLWAQGTGVIANGIATSIYRVHSTDVMEIYDNVGSGTTLRLEIPEPVKVSQPLPVVFGPDKDGYSYGLGDPANPGRLYVFSRYTMDSTRSDWFADITDANDQLQNGCVYNDRGYVWSTGKMWSIVPTLDQAERVAKSEVLGAPGLRYRWAMDVSDLMVWVANDGIYVSDGGTTRNITRQELQPLFPSGEGANGVDVNGILAPDFTAAQSAHRLTCSPGKFAYYNYQAITGGVRAALVLDRASGPEDEWGWWQDTYGFSAIAHFVDVSTTSGRTLIGGANATTAKLYAFASTAGSDDGTVIPCRVRSFAHNGGDSESEKKYGHVAVKANPGGATMTVTTLLDDFVTSFAPTASLTGSTIGDPRIVAELDTYARNVAVDVQWSNDTGHTPVLHLWTVSWLPRPVNTVKRPTDYSNFGYWGPKELLGLAIEVDTEGVAKDFVLEYTTESGTVATVAKTVTTPTKSIAPVSFNPPVIGYEFRIRGTDADTWKFFEIVEPHFNQLPDMGQMDTERIVFDGLRWVQGVEIRGDTNNVNVPLTVLKDFDVVAATITPFQHSGIGTKSYAFRPPFLAYEARLRKSANARILAAKFISKPEAPLGSWWESQEVELGAPYGYLSALTVEYASTADVTVTWTVDGVLAHTETLTSTGGLETFVRVSFPVTAAKGSLGKLVVKTEAANECRVRERGTQVYLSSWGTRAQWIPVIGAAHGSGADV
jgi:hypothetical protein